MTSTEELQALLHRTPRDDQAEAAFFRAMLNALIYTLAPLSDDHPRLRLITFTRPDGVCFVPLFTDEDKAIASAQGVLRVLCGTGRELLEATQGSVVVINPNDEHCALYQEEIACLLATGRIASIHTETLDTERVVLIGEPPPAPEWLVKRLQTLYADLGYVEAARLVTMVHEDNPQYRALTVVIVTAQAFTERAARATTLALQDDCRARNFALDIAVVPSDEVEDTPSGPGRKIYPVG